MKQKHYRLRPYSFFYWLLVLLVTATIYAAVWLALAFAAIHDSAITGYADTETHTEVRTTLTEPLSAYETVIPCRKACPPQVATPAPEHDADSALVWWTSNDVALMAAVISAESRGEPYEGQLAVGCVILNRLECRRWGNTVSDVLYYPNQFARPYWAYGESEEQAALDCLNGKRIFPRSVLFFKQARVDVWYDATWYTRIGCHNFYIVNGLQTTVLAELRRAVCENEGGA